MTARFKAGRPDGRSDAQVVCDSVAGGDPGRIYSYAELASALDYAGRRFARPAVCNAVRSARVRLGREQLRALDNVKGAGYRLAHANEHGRIAQRRRIKAARQTRAAVQVLRDVRLSEMTASERRSHEDQAMVAVAADQQLRALNRRGDRIEGVIRRRGEYRADASAVPADQ